MASGETLSVRVPAGIEPLLSRASVSTLGEPAPTRHELEVILEAGLRAPDHGRLRPGRFVLIQDAARGRFAELAAQAMLRRDPTTPQSLLDRQRARLQEMPLIIAVGAKIRSPHKIPEIEQVLSVGASVMNMLNAIHMLGYGGMWVTGANAYDSEINAALGFQAPDRLVGFVFVGTPTEALPVKQPPALSEHVIEWNDVPKAHEPPSSCGAAE